jgi:hypothetical protein
MVRRTREKDETYLFDIVNTVSSMQNNPLPALKNFIRKEKLHFSLSEEYPSDFWLDEPQGSITVRFRIDVPHHEISYDVYSPEYSVHLKEETLKDAERLEFIAEEHRRWRMAEIIEDIWLVLDLIKIWARQNDFTVTEKQLI